MMKICEQNPLLKPVELDIDFLPLRHREVLQTKLSPTQILKDGWDWLNNSSNQIFWLICGGVGCGKTIGALRVASHLLSRGHVSRSGEVFSLKEFSYSKACEIQWRCQEKASYLDEAFERKASILVLEELGGEHFAENPTYWFSKLEYLIDNRYESKKKTIIISNLSFEKLKEVYPERMMDRLKGLSLLTQSKEASLRGKKPALTER